MAKGVDPDQTAQEQSDLGLHCLPRPEYPIWKRVEPKHYQGAIKLLFGNLVKCLGLKH